MGTGQGRRRLVWGCLGLAGVAAVVATSFAVVVYRATRSTHVEQPAVAHVLPTAESDSGTAVPTQRIAGRVVLHAGTGAIYVEPAEPGEPLTLESSYDPGYYRLEEDLDPGPPWIYRVRFTPVGSVLVTGIKEMISGNPRARLRLPVDTPLTLELQIRNGSLTVDLGALGVSEADFTVHNAILTLETSRPPPERFGRVAIRGSGGTVVLHSMGTASPRELDVDFRMGNVLLDLRGPWAGDAAIGLDTAMSDVLLRLPRRVRIEGLADADGDPRGLPEIAPSTLDFEVVTGVRTNVKVFR